MSPLMPRRLDPTHRESAFSVATTRAIITDCP